MFQNNILPIGESGKHVPIEDCECGPTVKRFGQRLVLVHKSFDHREIWLAVEQMLGMTCYEHMLFVRRDMYIRGKPHDHINKPELHFEYDHEKIDPR